MTDTAHRSDAPPFLAAFMAMHSAMRRDLPAIPDAIERAVARDEVAALVRWFALVREIIEHHHHLEDDELWPDLDHRLPGFLAGTTELAADHVRLDEAMDAVTAALSQLTTTTDGDAVGDAVVAAEHLGELIVDHLGREEDAVIGPIETAFTDEEYEQFEKSAAKGTPLRLFAFGLPWLLDGVDETTRHNVLGPMPAAARLLFRPFRWWYERVAAPVRDH